MPIEYLFSRSKQDSRARKDLGPHHLLSASSNNVGLPAIIDELKTNDYKDDLIPSFQRVSISGEEMSGVILCANEPCLNFLLTI
jgi:hypothetical protein